MICLGTGALMMLCKQCFKYGASLLASMTGQGPGLQVHAASLAVMMSLVRHTAVKGQSLREQIRWAYQRVLGCCSAGARHRWHAHVQ